MRRAFRDLGWRRIRRTLQRHSFGLKLLSVGALGLGIGVAHVNGAFREIATAADRFLLAQGVGLEQVSLTGHRYTPDGDVFDAIGHANAHSLFSLDTAVAKARIEQLPWIERAVLTRVFPNRLDIVVIERQPALLWHMETGSFLLDHTGLRLGLVPASFHAKPGAPMLLVLRGEAADRDARGVLALLSVFPGLAHRIDHVERVAQRRWSLHLTDGRVVHLPSREPERALTFVLDLDRRGGLQGVREIDMRMAGAPVLVFGHETVSPGHSAPPHATIKGPSPKPPTG